MIVNKFNRYLKLSVPLCVALFFHPGSSSAQIREDWGDSVTIAIAPDYDSVSRFHRWLFGESYRKLWAAPVRLKVFYIGKEKGGLSIIERGGGLQTKSLRLKDNNGKEWVLRSVQKFPERALPKKLRATITKDILQDQVVTSHPYAALTVPVIADALGVYHTHPQIVYVPDDPALGAYRKDFGNAVLLFEEREPLGAPDTDNTEKAQKKAEESNDVRFDQKLLLRSRLMDLVLGDWDRHEEQWWWLQTDTAEKILYKPFPRDRDKVYYSTSGLFPWILSKQSGKTNLQAYKGKIKKIGNYNYNNRFFDRYFLNTLSQKDWEQEIAYVQSKLSDDVIRRAIRQFPDTIYKLSAEKIINTLIARRNNLRESALKYYGFLSRNVDIPASDKPEFFDIVSKENGEVDIKIYRTNKDSTKGDIIYQRSFFPKTTDEIRLFGLGGNDRYELSGTGKTHIRIHMIGGNGVDSFYVDPRLHNRSRLYIYDRSDQPNKLPSKALARLRISTDSAVNYFDKKIFQYDRVGPVLAAQYDLDLGLMVRGGMEYERQGFRRVPYKKRFSFFASYAPARQSFLWGFNSDIKKLFGQKDLVINFISRGPQNVSSFFGVGNESQFVKDGVGIEYYRNRYDYLSGDVRLQQSLGDYLRVNAGLGIQYYTSAEKNNANRFLSAYNAMEPGENVFSKQAFTGFLAGAEINMRKEAVFPIKGFYWNMQVTAMRGMNSESSSYGQLQSQAIFYLPLANTLSLAGRVGGGASIGKPAFFQQFQLGGYNTIRGFYVNRFTGKSALYYGVELRAKLLDFTSYLFPGTLGMIVYNDMGRVWTTGESSNKWHRGFGSGVFIIPADLILIQAAISKSVEGTQPYISIGLSF